MQTVDVQSLYSEQKSFMKKVDEYTENQESLSNMVVFWFIVQKIKLILHIETCVIAATWQFWLIFSITHKLKMSGKQGKKKKKEGSIKAIVIHFLPLLPLARGGGWSLSQRHRSLQNI